MLTAAPCFLCAQTARVPLDLSPRLEEALDFSEVEAEPSEGEDFEARGSRFSKSADERQRMLVQRKDDLLQQARKYVRPWPSLTQVSGHTPVARRPLSGPRPGFSDRFQH